MARITSKFTKCRHFGAEGAAGLALVVCDSGKTKPAGMTRILCDSLTTLDTQNVCRFDLDDYKGNLAQCLSGHRAAVIVDSVDVNGASNSIIISDISSVRNPAWPTNIEVAPYPAMLKELRKAGDQGHLPLRMVFFGIGTTADPEGAPPTNYLPGMVSRLTALISTILQTVARCA